MVEEKFYKKYLDETLFSPGHTACAGCGQNLAVRHVLNTLGKDTIIVNATGCLEVTTTKTGESSWKVPYIHSVFENSAAVASGVVAALKTKGLDKNTKVVVLAGDGSTFDIGNGLISGMWERFDDVLYVCFDNEGYQNTGYQASGSTTMGTFTTTTPPGKFSTGAPQRKKNMIALATSHGLPYVATSTAGYPKDIAQKVKEAMKYKGPKYIQILVPCIPGWGIDTNKTIKLGRLAAMTGLYPVIEIKKGIITKVLNVPEVPPKVEEYLKHQKRYKHLSKTSAGKKVIAELQNKCDQNIRSYGLFPKVEEHKILTHYQSLEEAE